MKSILKATLVFTLFHFNFIFSQEKNIETHSIPIENFISYVVENYDRNSNDIYNLFFLIQTSANGFSIENKVVLQQSFNLLFKRLSEDNSISILGYSNVNGVALEQTSIGEIKKIMYTLENFKPSVKEFQDDGTSYAYQYANKNFDKDAVNRVVMIRIPNSNNEENVTNLSQKPKKKKNNAVMLTAIALLPEIISVIKD